MNLDAFFASIAASPLAVAIQQSGFLFPAFESIHVIGVALVFGTIAIVDLRLVGLVGRNRTFSATMKDILPWTWIGFAVAAVAGSLLFISNASMYWVNGPFRFKMMCLALAGINMVIFELVASRRVSDWDANPQATPWPARICGALSITLWVLVVAFGRWVGFTLNPFGF
ncbi:DUF6644 family protein [Pelagibacterium halotolerans]|uniref:DUF6644 domain-containing protein n=1 Tax=Pelagibacterium halotolerans (strain DSM 22347 / JCM 15775 / CGMCC 1.7692 / B2) TaxID=1082931 RepID=G4R732_PELHB|nr:DUF6644 family protein [Pelagibacterium halotolerans]AEQ50186.1 hypothetical protein KKY_139 [Pelagibacterium halotolerans B2]QJR19808.1 hypothetical protein HKM20_16040 [Pelagibacterium halotolerans]SEA50072.1 hypothetical protein SAMN05428936_104221 [Pelagibacterium halotolerans]